MLRLEIIMSLLLCVNNFVLSVNLVDSHVTFITNQSGTEANNVISENVNVEENSQESSKWRIVGGERCSTYDYPFIVTIVEAPTRKIICGGSIITSDFVLTSAVNVKAVSGRPELIKVMVGFTIVREIRVVRQVQLQVADVKRIIVHKYFNSKDMKNDIALVQLERQVIINMDPPYHFVKIPSQTLPDDLSGICAGNLFTVGGWGDVAPHSPTENPLVTKNSPVIQCVDVPYITKEECMKYDAYAANDDIMCTLEPGGLKSPCYGDSGAPLFCDGTQYGIVSWGKGCAAPDSPHFYTRVDRYLDFIHETIIACKSGGNRVSNIRFCLLLAWVFLDLFG